MIVRITRDICFGGVVRIGEGAVRAVRPSILVPAETAKVGDHDRAAADVERVVFRVRSGDDDAVRLEGGAGGEQRGGDTIPVYS